MAARRHSRDTMDLQWSRPADLFYPDLGPVSLRLMTSQFKDIVTNTLKMKTVKCTKGALWNFTQNLEPTHRKICILRGVKNSITYESLSEMGPWCPSSRTPLTPGLQHPRSGDWYIFMRLLVMAPALKRSRWVTSTQNHRRSPLFLGTRDPPACATLQWRHNERDGVSNH